MSDLQNVIKNALEGNSKPFAVLDFDNTCIVNDIGEAALGYACRNKLLKDKTLLPDGEGDYHERVLRHYYDLLDKGEKAAYLFCAQIYSGFIHAEIDTLVSDAIDAEGSEIGVTELYGVKIAKGLKARPAVLEILEFLKNENIAIWVISASPEETVRTAMRRFGISGNLLGLRSKEMDGVLSKQIVEPYSIAEGKVSCIKKYIDADASPVFGIGDSMNDFPMIEYSTVHAIVSRNNALTKEAEDRSWFIL